jgi:asparagine synthase (glutamine-hydrolysing)
VVNGEIYNFEALRKELTAAGHRFVTRCDAEVVVHGYEAWGAGVVDRLDGMFALAVWDGRARRLLLARDRMGEKPLYVARTSAGLAFASELKALKHAPGVSGELDREALLRYLVFEHVPAPRSMLRGVSKLEPGTRWTIEPGGEPVVERYWDLPFVTRRREDKGPAARDLLSELTMAVRSRLVSDVPLGVFLSGGIDSSTVAALAVRERSDLATFSVGFDEPDFDESGHARRVAAHLGTRHHEERLSVKAMLDLLPAVGQLLDEPLADSSIVPTHLLARFARRHVTVALGGDGGDELFLGYPTFQADRVARGLDRLVNPTHERRLGTLAGRAARWLPVSRRNMSLDFKVKRFAQGLGFAPDLRHQAWMGSFLPAQSAALFTQEYGARALAESPYALVASFRERGGYRDHWDQLTYQYSRLYLTGCVLAKVDRASMAVGLEVRAPLLDTKMVDFANALPGELKLRGMTTKYILKQAARSLLPREILERPKKGFGVPVGEWLRGPLAPLAEQLLSPYNIGVLGYFDPRETSRLLDEHKRGVADHRKPLWTLISFLLWHERYGPGGSLCRASPAPLAEPTRSSVVHRLEASG